jgi:hypothetical protein
MKAMMQKGYDAENFAKLEVFLRALPMKRFNMQYFRTYQSGDDHEDVEIYEIAGKPVCGTVGCALGWGPEAGVIPHPRHDRSWYSYSQNRFSTDERIIKWVFDSEWVNHDNTPTGAADRIAYLLKHGHVPVSFRLSGVGRNDYPYEKFKEGWAKNVYD